MNVGRMSEFFSACGLVDFVISNQEVDGGGWCLTAKIHSEKVQFLLRMFSVGDVLYVLEYYQLSSFLGVSNEEIATTEGTSAKSGRVGVRITQRRKSNALVSAFQMRSRVFHQGFLFSLDRSGS